MEDTYAHATHTHSSKYLISVITGGIIPAVIAIVFTHCSHYSPLTLDDSVDSMHAPRVINSNRWDTNTNADRIRNSLLQPTSKETIAPEFRQRGESYICIHKWPPTYIKYCSKIIY